jgi:hypothetical protein
MVDTQVDVRGEVMAVPSRLAQRPGPSGEAGARAWLFGPADDRLGDKSRSAPQLLCASPLLQIPVVRIEHSMYP